MQRLFKWAGVMTLSAAMVIGCATDQVGTASGGSPAAGTGEKLLWASETPRPKWVMKIPASQGGNLFFVASSAYYSTEEDSREDAMRMATDKVVKFVYTLAKNKFERAQTTSGLKGDMHNATAISKEIQEQLSTGGVSGLKDEEYYAEKWETPTGIGFKTFVLASVPKSSLDGSLAGAVDKQLADTMKKQKAANDETAKKQLDSYAENLKKMKQAGVVQDDKDGKE